MVCERFWEEVEGMTLRLILVLLLAKTFGDAKDFIS